MAIKRAKEVISDFLSSSQPDALVLKGRWGTGKTYTWSQLVSILATSQMLGKSKYAYVSLFGINSLEQLRDAIFEQTLAVTAISQGASFATLRRNLEDVFVEPAAVGDDESIWHRIKRKLTPTANVLNSQARKTLPYVERIPFLKDFLPFVRSASFLSVKDTIVCLDDFERKGDQLTAKEILGLISMLKEQRNCKVAIILNDEFLQGEAIDDYNRYREKVVDIEVDFRPSSRECVDLVFCNGSLTDSMIRENATKLNIQNIRILQKLKRLVDGIWQELECYEEKVRHQVVHSLVLMSWSFYSREGDAPPLKYILNIGYRLLGFEDDEEETSAEEKNWNAIILNYGYTTTDELDSEVAGYIQRGFFLKDSLKEKLEAKNVEVVAYMEGHSFSEAWRLYHDSFSENEAELVETMSTRLRASARHVAPEDLQNVVKLFRELGHDSLADDLIEVYVAENRFRPKIFALESYPFHASHITDRRIKERFSEIATAEERQSLAEVIKNICFKNGWSGKDEGVLDEATPEDYYNFFKSETSKDLAAYIDTCLQFERFSNASERKKRIAAKATEALKRIAMESKLNEMRVRKFGIHIESAKTDKAPNQQMH